MRLKYDYSVISVIVDSLAGNTKNWESTCSWLIKVRLFLPWAGNQLSHSCCTWRASCVTAQKKIKAPLHLPKEGITALEVVAGNVNVGSHIKVANVPTATYYALLLALLGAWTHSWSLSHLGHLYPGTTPVMIKLDHNRSCPWV